MKFESKELKKLIQESDVETTEDLQGFLRDLTKDVIETLYQGELTAHLGYEKHEQNTDTDNSRNGYGNKTVKSNSGEIDLNPPRDRKGTFDPKIVKKGQKDISGIETKVISMYARGMSTRDIQDHIHDIYGYNLSPATISAITDKVLKNAQEWQSRPLKKVYPIVFMDGIVVKLRVDGVIKNVTVYVVLGIDITGHKSCLGLYVADTESAKYWLSVMNELKNRGVEDIFIFAVDNLSGISEAITTAFPKSEIQKCIVHQIRNSLKYVPWKERKEVANDLKKIYKASSKKEGEKQLDNFEDKWGEKYHHIGKSWRDNWSELSVFFKYPPSIRKLIYTTNPIESFHRTVRKGIKTKSSFTTEDSLLKLFYLIIQNVEKKWTQRIRKWGEIYSQLSIYFEERMENYV